MLARTRQPSRAMARSELSGDKVKRCPGAIRGAILNNAGARERVCLGGSPAACHSASRFQPRSRCASRRASKRTCGLRLRAAHSVAPADR